MKKDDIILTSEQELFIKRVLEGNNVLVDACCGSGKTTTIQELCNRIPSDKKILYLTYNRLLKIDAKRKIKNTNAMVTNYHGFASWCCFKAGLSADKGDLIQTFLREINHVPIFDILILDEYQDISDEISKMLEKVKAFNPQIQIAAVGDMKQKIYDQTHLDVFTFVKDFLGEDCIELEFTKCFRLSAEYANKIGGIWDKKIEGINPDCKISTISKDDVVGFLSKQKPKDVLCLGARTGTLSKVLNDLEDMFPEVYNKKTVFASIQDSDTFSNIKPNSRTAIFTTYDGSKGMERDICIVFDFVPSYWKVRIDQPNVNPEILRNIFMVAASRGKRQIIFVEDEEKIIDEKYIPQNMNGSNAFTKPFNISEMFDFKFKENVEECFSLLECTPIKTEDNEPILIKSNDDMIDLSPCIGIYQEAAYFNNYDIDREFDLIRITSDFHVKPKEEASLEEKILLLTSFSTKQKRYAKQVTLPFIDKYQDAAIKNRLKTRLTPDEEEQIPVRMDVEGKRGNENVSFGIVGLADVLKDNIPYELKFVSELSHEHFLQLATYMIGLKVNKGYLWNIYNNTVYEVKIPDKKEFLEKVINCISKETVIPKKITLSNELRKQPKIK